jgi:hypothetical protein
MADIATLKSLDTPRWLSKGLSNAGLAVKDIRSGRTRPRLITKVTPQGRFRGDASEPISKVGEILVGCGRLYRQGNSTIFLRGGRPGPGSSPQTVVVDEVCLKHAPEVLANVVMCRDMKQQPASRNGSRKEMMEIEDQFAVPRNVLQQAIVADGFAEMLPEATFIFMHPVFDESFHWLESGYHGDQKILVCGPDCEPLTRAPEALWTEPPQTVKDVCERLPPLIRRWVEGFHWNGPVDLINYIGAALMVPLMPLLVRGGHPGVMFWGNQPGIGKSLAAQCLAILKDGVQASPASMDRTPREIENQIASELNDGRTVIYCDNLKGRMDIPCIEAVMTGSEVGIRIFHAQKRLRRANDVLFLFTTNSAQPSDDMLTRCVHIRLNYEGSPDCHPFQMSERELAGFLETNRLGILAELAGMVMHWLDAGLPSKPSPSRFTVCGQVIGSVLAANGVPGFLSNSREESLANSSTHQHLVDLATRIIREKPEGFVWEADCPLESALEMFSQLRPAGNKRQQEDWVPLLTKVGVVLPGGDESASKSMATKFLKSVTNKPVDVEVGDETCRAAVVWRNHGSHRLIFALAVQFPSGSPIDLPAQGGPCCPSTAVEGTPEPSGGVCDAGPSATPAAEPALGISEGGGDLWD